MKTSENLIWDLCEQIDDLKFQLEQSEKENKRLQQQFAELLNRDIQHGHAMMQNTLALCLKLAETDNLKEIDGLTKPE